MVIQMPWQMVVVLVLIKVEEQELLVIKWKEINMLWPTTSSMGQFGPLNVGIFGGGSYGAGNYARR